jgi:hypothetical protein
MLRRSFPAACGSARSATAGRCRRTQARGRPSRTANSVDHTWPNKNPFLCSRTICHRRGGSFAPHQRAHDNNSIAVQRHRYTASPTTIRYDRAQRLSNRQVCRGRFSAAIPVPGEFNFKGLAAGEILNSALASASRRERATAQRAAGTAHQPRRRARCHLQPWCAKTGPLTCNAPRGCLRHGPLRTFCHWKSSGERQRAAVADGGEQSEAPLGVEPSYRQAKRRAERFGPARPGRRG